MSQFSHSHALGCGWELSHTGSGNQTYRIRLLPASRSALDARGPLPGDLEQSQCTNEEEKQS